MLSMIRLARGVFATALALCLTTGSRASAQLSPADELKTLKAADGIDVALFASEPLITNPAAIDVDTKGRVWVAEIEFYRGGAKNPPADKIKVLEDTDGDGAADKVTVFAEGLFAPMSVCVAGDKVYVATSPDLWVFEDKNGDLKADGPPKKLLTGFGGYNHDHGAHSIVLGPDHKWWMSHGDEGFDVRGTDGSHVKYPDGAVLRGELDGSKLETVAVNFRNPYEVCVDSFGNAFLSDNDNDGNESVRICWIMEGGDYGWFGRPPFDKQELDARVAPGTPYREHWHFRGFLPGFVPATLVTGFGSPTGMCIYESDVFGEKFANAPLHTDCGPRECRAYQHRPQGFGMTATSEVFLSNEGDNYFRPDDICAAPDGSLYVSDWYDGGVGGHGYNNPSQGRIFRLTPKDKQLQRHEKPGPYANVADAVEGLKSPNLATQFLARERLLADGAASVPALVALLDDAEPNYRARAVWLLDRIGGDARQHVVAQLKNMDPAMRALAVRILRQHGEEYGEAILSLASDPAAEVRREALLTIRTLPGDLPLEVLAKMAATYDGSDRYQLEAINIAAGDRKAALLAALDKQGPLEANQFPLVQVLAPERAAALLLAQLRDKSLSNDGARQVLDEAARLSSEDAGWGLLDLAAQSDRSAELRKAALAKVVGNVGPRGGWGAMLRQPRFGQTLETLLADDQLSGDALAAIDELRLRSLGDQVLAKAQDANLGPAARKRAIRAAAHLQPAGAADAFRKLLADSRPDVAAAAISGLVDLQDIRSLREIMSGETTSSELQRRAADRLVDSTAGAILLLRLIDEGKLSDELKQAVVAKANAHPDANVRVLYEKFIPEGERPQKLGAAIAADDILALNGDANRGRNIFFKSSAAQCNQCHAVNGFGNTLGPELTNIGKKYERKALLETILLPSKAIGPEYVPYVLETSSGQVYAGFLVEKTDQQVVLRDVKNQVIRVPAEEVEALVQQQKSLMPELVLSQVTAQDAADLLAFLESLK
jgi:putative membrane-bound dehydrogenase-like protein